MLILSSLIRNRLHLIVRQILLGIIISGMVLCACFEKVDNHVTVTLLNLIERNHKFFPQKEWLEISPEGKKAWLNKEWKNAESIYSKVALKLKKNTPQYNQAFLLSIIANCFTEKPLRCLVEFKEAVNLFPDLKYHLYFLMINRILATEYWEAGIKIFEELIREEGLPSWFLEKLYKKIGDTLFEKGRKKEALLYYDNYLRSSSEINQKFLITLIDTIYSFIPLDVGTGDIDCEVEGEEVENYVVKLNELYHRLLLKFPWVNKDVLQPIEEKIKQLKAIFPQYIQLSLSPEEEKERLLTLYNNHYYKEVLMDIDNNLKYYIKGSLAWCEMNLLKGRAIYKTRKWREAGEFLKTLKDSCPYSEVRIPALFLSAKALNSAGDIEGALSLAEEFEKFYPKHSFADDMRLLRAIIYMNDLKNTRKAQILLEKLPEDYPEGDMKEEALWRLAWNSYLKKEEDQVVNYLSLLMLNEKRGYHERGRAIYWLARWKKSVGQLEEAKKLFFELISKYPFSFYTLMAINDTLLRDGELLDKGILEIVTTNNKRLPSWLIHSENSDGYWSSRFNILKLFWSLGLQEFFEFEYRRWDFKEIPQSVLWELAILHHQLGNYNISHNIMRRYLTEWYDYYPVDESHRRFWEVAYPTPWDSLFMRTAKELGVPPELLYAIAREESGFVPTIRSWAGAIGLMQLMPSTAKLYAQKYNIGEVTPQNLTDKELSLKIASYYIKELLMKFNNNLILTIAGYNAGEGAINRWLKQKDRYFDIVSFVESIPYEQTRNYTKRVFSSLGIYYYMLNNSFIRVNIEMEGRREK